MRMSGLDNSILAQIWTIVNVNGQGSLNPNGFSVALRLIGLAQNGVSPSLQSLVSQQSTQPLSLSPPHLMISDFPIPRMSNVQVPPPPQSTPSPTPPYTMSSGGYSASPSPYASLPPTTPSPPLSASPYPSTNPYNNPQLLGSNTPYASVSPSSAMVTMNGGDQWILSPEKRQSFLQMFQVTLLLPPFFHPFTYSGCPKAKSIGYERH